MTLLQHLVREHSANTFPRFFLQPLRLLQQPGTQTDAHPSIVPADRVVTPDEKVIVQEACAVGVQGFVPGNDH